MLGGMSIDFVGRVFVEMESKLGGSKREWESVICRLMEEDYSS